jgi:hypothetical protein
MFPSACSGRKETTKIMKENSTGTKHKWKTCRGRLREKKVSEPKKQRSKILEAYENKYHTHLKMAM